MSAAAERAGGGEVRAFAPGSVSNVGCGFDVFGFAVDAVGDVVEAWRRDEPGVVLAEVVGDDGRLPRQAGANTAGVAAMRLLERAGRTGDGVELCLAKGMPLASGLGSSAASAVAAVVAVDALLGTGLAKEDLLACAVEGERVACGAAHADNAAPSLYGGFVLVRGGEPPRVDRLPVPAGLTCALLRPHAEVETRAARAALGDVVALDRAVIQWGNTAAFVAALFRGDLELLASAVHDVVAEPLRAAAVPGFAAVTAAARRAGALGCGLSGSGPTIFALCADTALAGTVGAAMSEALHADAGLGGDLFISPVDAPGARLLEDPPPVGTA